MLSRVIVTSERHSVLDKRGDLHLGIVTLPFDHCGGLAELGLARVTKSSAPLQTSLGSGQSGCSLMPMRHTRTVLKPSQGGQ